MDRLTNDVQPYPMNALRGVVRWLLAAALLLVGLVLPSAQGTGRAQAALQTEQRAGLIVSYGDGRVEMHCIDLGEDGQATGEEVLRGAGLDLSADYGSGLGAGVCQIENVGCSFPAESCFCQCTLNPGEPCRYWGYSHLENGEWRFSNRGASTSIVQAGGVEGWAWGDATIGNVAEPPVVPFDQICLAAATATSTPSPQPTETATPQPSPTDIPTETPAPTETASATPEPSETPVPSATASTAPSNTPLPSTTRTRVSSNTALPNTATPSRVAATATRTATSSRVAASATRTSTTSRVPATATRTATSRPVPSQTPTPTLRPTWTLFPLSPTSTGIVAGGAGGEEPSPTSSASATREPTASSTSASTLTVTLPTKTTPRPAPTRTSLPTATPELEAAAPTPTLAIALADLPANPPTPATVVESVEARDAVAYWLFAAIVVVLGATLIVLRARQR